MNKIRDEKEDQGEGYDDGKVTRISKYIKDTLEFIEKTEKFTF